MPENADQAELADAPAGALPRAPRRALAALLIGAFALVVSLTGVADRVGEQAVESGLQRALVAFAIARSLNGVISVVQGTEVAVQPAGIGLNLAPGQILDPVNDLVERFSWVMLVASTTFGVERLLLEMFAWHGVTAVLGILFLLLSLAFWQRSGWLAGRRDWLLRLALFALVVRFLVPALALAGEALHEAFVAPRYEAAVAGLEEVTGRIESLRETTAEVRPPEATWSERVQRWFEDTGEAFDVSSRLEAFQAVAGEAVDRTVELTAIFVFQTIVFPLAFLWFMRAAYRMLVRAWFRGRGDPGG